MNTLSTNAITNVYNVGAGSCDAGTKYCTNEYALYFPCLKDVTRGQNVCFDFYIADGSTQDVVDLRTVDAITLNLNGQFNCSYGSFSYPDNILSLQKEEYSQIYESKQFYFFFRFSFFIEQFPEHLCHHINNNGVSKE